MMNNLLSKPEFYWWYLLPTVVGLVTLVWTAKMVSKNTDAKNVIFAVLIFVLLGLSQWVLILIFFFDAWPSFFPHIAIGFSVILVIVKYLINREEKNNGKTP